MLIQFLGGVDAGLILAGFVVTGMTMISLGSLSMAVSVSAKSSTAAIFITYGLSAFLFACVACFPGIGNPVRVFLFGMADDPGNPAGTAEIVLIVAITVLIHAFITSRVSGLRDESTSPRGPVCRQLPFPVFTSACRRPSYSKEGACFFHDFTRRVGTGTVSPAPAGIPAACE
jgi:hypothetical protein